ncbi:hypothetical protein SAMN04488118_103122 [Epibacterium ulvae]|uniref:Uncharacterized protein n=1 Tax=Epibacterium ulvae TaxID=1156985 RepID=A0A1G5Q8G7_9RHOB|nr:hypothetical protein SAMN04488118_103122 [Epibacterium ulvae]
MFGVSLFFIRGATYAPDFTAHIFSITTEPVFIYLFPLRAACGTKREYTGRQNDGASKNRQ